MATAKKAAKKAAPKRQPTRAEKDKANALRSARRKAAAKKPPAGKFDGPRNNAGNDELRFPRPGGSIFFDLSKFTPEEREHFIALMMKGRSPLFEKGTADQQEKKSVAMEAGAAISHAQADLKKKDIAPFFTDMLTHYRRSNGIVEDALRRLSNTVYALTGERYDSTDFDALNKEIESRSGEEGGNRSVLDKFEFELKYHQLNINALEWCQMVLSKLV